MSSGNRTFGASPDCAVVAKFGFITDSPNCCQSRDVSCRDGRVVAIDSYYWSGRSSLSSSSRTSSSAAAAAPKKDFTIPADIDSLTELERLKVVMSQDASYRAGTTIPPSIGKLSKLTEIELRDGGLTGTIPAEIADIPNLGSLRLTNHSLTGTIPPGIGNLKNLTRLDLSRNKLTGSLPIGLGDRNLTTLDVKMNNLTGIVPKLSPTIYDCELTGRFDGNEFWCYGAGGAAPPSMCDMDTRAFLPRTCPAGLDGSGPSPLTRPGFIATIVVAVLIPILAVLCVKKAKRVPTFPEEDEAEKPVAAVATVEGGEAAAENAAAATEAAAADKKEEKPKRKCLCLDVVPGVKLLLAVQILAGIALAYMAIILAASVAAISPRTLSYASLTVSDRDYLVLMTHVSAGLGAWSSLLALFGLVCAFRKHLQGFKLFTAVYWGYIFAMPINLAITYLSFSGSVRLKPASIASCVIQFYWGLCFAAFIEQLEEEKEKELLAEGAEEIGENPSAPAAAGALEAA